MLTSLYTAVANFVINRLISKSLAGLPAAVAKQVNVAALTSIAFAAYQTGGGFVAVQQALLAHVADYVPAENVTLVASGLVFTFEVERRLGIDAPKPAVNVTP